MRKKKSLILVSVILLGLIIIFLKIPSDSHHSLPEGIGRPLYHENETLPFILERHHTTISHIRLTTRQVEVIENEIRYWNYNRPNESRIREKALTIVHYSQLYNVCPMFITAVAIVESNLRQNVLSPAGAVGILQLMPIISEKFQVNPYNLKGNIKGGVAYLNFLYKKYECWDLALTHYNAGSRPESKLLWPSVKAYRWNVYNIQNSLLNKI